MTTTEHHTEPSQTAQPTPALTRAQRRHNDHINKEAGRIHKLLCDKFIDYMVECDDPEDVNTNAYIKQLSAQWMLFCKRKNIKPELYNVIQDYCVNAVNEYRRDKASGDTVPM